ncbi:hypothetical protein RBH62_24670 [Pseudomonas aeruginosa]|uniref:hypothetical protein n=1 Tax=Pseudomonas aeruginosa TaxID=287 RepID=UPI0027D1F75D|nr:hypothetical protein [Pseudomonas aeruginosa]WMB67018.1 hypothetical protein RBH62_24670 [Pseudomonas aeruginosa]
MKRKTTTEQTVKSELARLLRQTLREVREARSDYLIDDAQARARGAIYLAYHCTAITDTAFDALTSLVSNATAARRTELIYGYPPYTGAFFAEARRDADEQVAA